MFWNRKRRTDDTTVELTHSDGIIKCPVCHCNNFKIGHAEGAQRARIFECGLTVSEDNDRLSHCDRPGLVEHHRHNAKMRADEMHAAAEARVKLDAAEAKIDEQSIIITELRRDIAARELAEKLAAKDAEVAGKVARADLADARDEIASLKEDLARANEELAKAKSALAEAKADVKASKTAKPAEGASNDAATDALKKIRDWIEKKEKLAGATFPEGTMGARMLIKKALNE